MAQLNHYNTNFTSKKFPITLLCDNVFNAPNIGGLFRICDAMGVEKLVLSGKVELGKKMEKSARATDKIVPFEIVESIESIIDSYLRTHHIIGLEITDNSTPLHTIEFNKNQPIALIIGNENFGISEAVLDSCHTVLHINMYGKNSSMNVVQATAITLYELTKQLS